ncbi:sensor histidine kinase [Paenibacillus pasadenensis]|uniref:cache domain-containing sensor histidine kinase n=1 Tax=Paenibacillus pasadenensis TaxID=217090 RepID=UPI00203F492D|nr:sensor histidine kinase [Paenibacillus pasadenensis]MCM3747010.1 sensor histidine kinase [Paenibacillus pasadenensis]
MRRLSLKRLQITSKMFLLIFLCFESLILLLGYSYHKYSSGLLIESQMNYASQMVQKADRYLEMNMRHIRSSLLTLCADPRFAEPDANEQLRNWLRGNHHSYLPNVSNIHIVSDGSVIASTSLNSWDLFKNSILKERLEGQKELNRVQWIGPYFSSVSGQTLTVAMRFVPVPGKTYEVMMDVDLESLYAELLPVEPSASIGELMILDSERNPVYGRKPYLLYDYRSHSFSMGALDSEFFRNDWLQTPASDRAGNELIVTRGINDFTGWQIVWIMTKNELLKPLDSFLRLSGWLALISLMLSVVISFILSSFVSRPIRQIASSLHEVGNGNLDTEIRMNRMDEIGFLAFQFNHMTRKIRDLIRDLKETEQQKKRSDFQALHLQIKPHFLYNTLNTISMMGRQGRTDRVDKLISALTNQLHYTLDLSPAPVTFLEELKAAENYADLMKERYPGAFELSLDIDPLTFNQKLPKFILQPLLENAIFHGLAPGQREGTLFIGACMNENSWEILIEDDGTGMSENTLRQLKVDIKTPMSERSGGKHIGLANVHERLQLMFGSDFQLEIGSEEGIGTRITLRLPLTLLDERMLSK